MRLHTAFAAGDKYSKIVRCARACAEEHWPEVGFAQKKCEGPSENKTQKAPTFIGPQTPETEWLKQTMRWLFKQTHANPPKTNRKTETK
jgi:hypothetical protein